MKREAEGYMPGVMREKENSMRKIIVTLVVATLLSATASVPAFADGWGEHRYDGGLPGGILWPVVAALSIPAAVIDTVTHAAFPIPVGYSYPATAGPTVYAGPAAYYAPSYEPRVYVEPRGYYAPRGYYRERGYRTYRRGW
jgi:hypothetical protein